MTQDYSTKTLLQRTGHKGSALGSQDDGERTGVRLLVINLHRGARSTGSSIWRRVL